MATLMVRGVPDMIDLQTSSLNVISTRWRPQAQRPMVSISSKIVYWLVLTCMDVRHGTRVCVCVCTAQSMLDLSFVYNMNCLTR